MRCKLFKHYDELHKVIFRENKGTVVNSKRFINKRYLNKRINRPMVIVIWWDWDVLIKYFSDSLLLSRSLNLINT